MHLNTMLAWGLAAAMALGIAAPGHAQKPTTPPGHQEAKVRIVVTEIDDKDDVRAFQSWYGTQMRDYQHTDPETGERIADLLQMALEVADGRMLVTDQSGLRRGVMVNNRTRIVLPKEQMSLPFGLRKPTTELTGKNLTGLIRPGDLVIAEGYLRVNGGIVATTIRLIGRARGCGYDDIDYRITYGFRTWGEVRMVDARRNRFEITLDRTTRTITLERNAVVLANARQMTLDYLRRGDRVVVYSKDGGRGDLTAYRVVVLQNGDRYPEGDYPCWTDPDYRDDRLGKGPSLEGQLQYISTGIFFNTMVVRGNNGRNLTVRFGKTLEAIERNGRRISPLNLRANERLRIYYTDIAGTLFAERIEVL